MSDGKALVVRQPDTLGIGHPFSPRSIEEGEDLSKFLATSSIVPRALQGKPADVFVVLMTGHDLGLSPSKALRGINVVDGKPQLGAELLVALVLQSGKAEYFECVETTETQATFETKRGNRPPIRLTYTIAEAQQQGLVTKDNWKKAPKAMLRHRAASNLAHMAYQDVVFGIDDPDDVDERAPAPVAPIPASPRPAARVLDITSKPTPAPSPPASTQPSPQPSSAPASPPPAPAAAEAAPSEPKPNSPEDLGWGPTNEDGLPEVSLREAFEIQIRETQSIADMPRIADDLKRCYAERKLTLEEANALKQTYMKHYRTLPGGERKTAAAPSQPATQPAPAAAPATEASDVQE